MAQRFTATVPGTLGSRNAAGALVRAVCLDVERAHGCSGLEWRVMSAFNEAFNNVIEHAYATREGEVEVRLTVHDDRLAVELIDAGERYDFDRAGATTAPAFETLSEGGMGLFIIRSVMSEVTYEHQRGYNHLTLIKRLSECPGDSGTAGE